MDILVPIILPRSRKGAILTIVVLMAVCAVIAIIILISWFNDQNVLKEKGQPDFNGLSMEQLEDGLIVKGTIDMLVDTYAEKYKTNFGIRTSDESENLYYILPVYSQAEDGSLNIQYFMTYKAEPEDFDTLNKIVEQTWSDSGQNVFTVRNGMVLNLPGEIKKYLNEWMEAPDFYENGSFLDWCAEMNIFGTPDKEVIKSKIAPFMLQKTETAGTNIQLLWIFGGLEIVLLIVLIVVIFSKRAGSRPGKKEVNPYRNEWQD